MDYPTCDRHEDIELSPDTLGHWYCPDCADEAHAAQINKGVPHAGGRLPAGRDSLLTPEPGSPPYLIPKRAADGRGSDFLAQLNEQTQHPDIADRAKALLEGVTAGPWEWHFPESYGSDELRSTTQRIPYHDGLPDEKGNTSYAAPVLAGKWGNDETAGISVSDADAAFIAAARELVPELVAEVERLRALVPTANPYYSECCPGGCDCSCCYGYKDRSCHHFADVCNCGVAHGPRAVSGE